MLELNCDTKNRYETEILARSCGTEFSLDRSVPLFVYRCVFCNGWHLTKKTLSDYWNVDYQFSENDVYTMPFKDPLFWHRLVQMPFVEAERLLRVMHHKTVELLGGLSTVDNQDAQRFISRIKAEIHYISRRNEGSVFREAIVKFYGEDGWDRVYLEVDRLRDKTRKESLDS